MKKKLLLCLTGVFALGAMAQNKVVPNVVNDVVAFSISANGAYIMAQDPTGSAVTISTSNWMSDTYAGYYPGGNNPQANNGVLVGQSFDLELAVMFESYAVVPKQFRGAGMSMLESITPDGSRASGYMSNIMGYSPLQVPIFATISDDGTLTDFFPLPYPAKDFFGAAPQYINAGFISADGHTIVGQVMSGDGFFCYPIIYREINGRWSYTLPTEKNFNPDGLPLPVEPSDDIVQPQIYDFMTAEKAALWKKDLAAYENDNSLPNPWDHVLDYMSYDDFKEYEAAIDKYNEEVEEYYKKLDEYWDAINKLTRNRNYAQNQYTLKADGSVFATAKVVEGEYDGVSDVAAGYVVEIFDVETGASRIINSKNKFLLPRQFLKDGTLVALDPMNFCDYFLLDGAEEFITTEEYMQAYHPTWLLWMEENLSNNITESTESGVNSRRGICAGILSFNEDCTVMAGGNRTDFSTYVFGLSDSGVDGIAAEEENTVTVYSLQGVKVLETQDKNEVDRLPAGIYIVNGRKTVVR